MSYLDIPRIHFGGLFFTNPSTINNYDASFNTSVQLTNSQGQYLTNDPNGDGGPAGWNAVGTAQLWLAECTVLSAVGPGGTPVAGDPVLGALVESPSPTTPKTTPDGKGFYDIAKLVDLDPDQQFRSAVYGLRIYVTIPGEGGGTGFSGLMSVPELQFLNGRVGVSAGSWSAVGTWMGQMTEVSWFGNVASSPLLTALRSASPQGIAVKLTIDLHQNNPTTRLTPGNMFCYGRVLGSLGPIRPGELAQVVPGRQIAPPPSSPSPTALAVEETENVELPPPGLRTIDALFRKAAPAVARALGAEAEEDSLAPWNTAFAQISTAGSGSMLHVDLGGSILLQGSVDSNGVGSSNGQFVVNSGISLGILTAPGTVQPLANGQVSFTNQYQPLASQNKQVDLVKSSGLVDIPLQPAEATLLRTSPLVVTVNGTTVLQEPSSGIQAGAQPFSVRLQPGTSATVQVMVRKFGQPVVGQRPITSRVFVVGNTLQPSSNVSIAWNGATDANGIGTLTVSTVSADPTLPAFRDPMDSQVYYVYLLGPDGQIIGDGYGQRVGQANGSVSVLRFQSYTAPAQPTWQNDVGPVLQAYARLYPGMKDRLDIGDEATVVGFVGPMLQRMSLPFLDPAYMPVTRDLSPAKVAMILTWLNAQSSIQPDA